MLDTNSIWVKIFCLYKCHRPTIYERWRLHIAFSIAIRKRECINIERTFWIEIDWYVWVYLHDARTHIGEMLRFKESFYRVCIHLYICNGSDTDRISTLVILFSSLYLWRFLWHPIRLQFLLSTSMDPWNGCLFALFLFLFCCRLRKCRYHILRMWEDFLVWPIIYRVVVVFCQLSLVYGRRFQLANEILGTP